MNIVRRIAVHGGSTAGILFCLSMIAFAPYWKVRLMSAFFLMAFVAVMILFWPEPKETP